jgi:hypothetical protein
MAVKYKKDYVYTDKSMLGTEFFIGTKNLIFTYPIKTQEGGGNRTVQNVEFFIKGEKPDVYFKNLLENKKTTLESLEAELKERVNDFEEKDTLKCRCKSIEDHKYFKVTSSLLGSSLILTNKKFGLNKLVVTPLGKQYKNEIKEFYKNSLKL